MNGGETSVATDCSKHHTTTVDIVQTVTFGSEDMGSVRSGEDLTLPVGVEVVSKTAVTDSEFSANHKNGSPSEVTHL